MGVPENKTCSACLSSFSFDQFYKATKTDRLEAYCKKCSNKISNKTKESQKFSRIERGLCKFCNNTKLPYQNQVCEKHYLVAIAARVLGKADNFMVQELQEKLKSQNWLCPYTGDKLILGLNTHLDHKFPVSRYPERATDMDNLEWVSKRANLAKSDMTPEEFIDFCKLIVSHSQHIGTALGSESKA